MDFHINTVTQCPGANHRVINLTVGQGAARNLTLTRDDITPDPEDTQAAVIDRIRSALKEAGATLVLATWKTALEGKDFKV